MSGTPDTLTRLGAHCAHFSIDICKCEPRRFHNTRKVRAPRRVSASGAPLILPGYCNLFLLAAVGDIRVVGDNLGVTHPRS